MGFINQQTSLGGPTLYLSHGNNQGFPSHLRRCTRCAEHPHPLVNSKKGRDPCCSRLVKEASDCSKSCGIGIKPQRIGVFNHQGFWGLI